MKRSSALLALTAVTLCGQASLSGPAKEYIFDPGTQTIRAIIGAPGSAYLSDSVTGRVAFGSVAPNGFSAIVVNSRASDLIADLSKSAAPIPLVGAIENPDQILWAQDSSSAVLFCSRSRSLQFVTQANQQPFVQPKIDLSTLESNTVEATRAARAPVNRVSAISLLAIDPAAKQAVVAVNRNGQADIYLVQNGVSPLRLMSGQSASAAAFATDGSLYLVDGTAGQVTAIRNPSDSPQIQALPAPQTALGQPVAVAVEANQLYIADSAANRIRIYDAATLQLTAELQLDSAPSALELFSATSFLVNARRKVTDPILLLQTSPTPTVIFIPSGANH